MKMTQITISEVTVKTVASIPVPVITGYFWSADTVNSNVSGGSLPRHTIQIEGKFYSPKDAVCEWVSFSSTHSAYIEKDGKRRKATVVTLSTGEKYLRAVSGGSPEVTFGNLPTSKIGN